MSATRSVMEQLPPIFENEEEGIVDEPVEILGREPEKPETEEESDSSPPEEESQEQSESSPAAEETEQKRGEKEGAEQGERSAEDADSTSTKSRSWDALEQSFARDPVTFIRSLAQNLTPDQLQALGVSHPVDPPDEPGWKDDELTAPERFVKQNRKTLAELPRFAEDVTQTFGQHAQYITHTLNENAALRAQVNALAEFLDVKLPAAKFTRYDPAAHQAYEAEVKKAIGAKKAVARPTPRTPLNSGSGTGAAPDIPKNASFSALFRAVKAASK